VAEVLLDQRVFCGVGNVYRCEVLWVCELSPFARVNALTESDAVRLVNVAASLLRANLQSATRVTVPGVRGGLAVYGRTGQRCSRCGGTVDMRRSGSHARLLYWCPGCQLRHDPRATRAEDDTPMDRHPAAVRFRADMPWQDTG
jgi:endonuclease VIII